MRRGACLVARGLLPECFMILAISIRPTLFNAPLPKRALRTVLLLLAAALPVVAVSVL